MTTRLAVPSSILGLVAFAAVGCSSSTVHDEVALSVHEANPSPPVFPLGAGDALGQAIFAHYVEQRTAKGEAPAMTEPNRQMIGVDFREHGSLDVARIEACVYESA